MALSIKDRATEAAVRALAEATGEGLTQAIRKAAEERLLRVRGGARPLRDQIREIADHCSALPDLDTRLSAEILGYDDHGLPT